MPQPAASGNAAACPRLGQASELSPVEQRRASEAACPSSLARCETGHRNQPVDSLRVVLIVGVLAYHLLVRWAPPFHAVSLYGFDTSYPSGLALGRLGVPVFFAITGWALPDALQRAGSAGRFLYRRFARLYPAYGACLALTWLAMAAAVPPDFQVAPADLIGSLMLVPERLGGHFVDGSYWSLAVEAKVIAWAALTWCVLGRRYWQGLAGLAGLACALSIGGPRCAALADSALVAPHLGFFLAGLALRFRIGAAALVCGLSAALCLWTARASVVVPEEPAMASAAVLAGGLLLLAVATGRSMALPLLPALGRGIYPFYLLHQKIGVSLAAGLKGLGAPDLGAVLLAGLGCGGLALLVHRCVERPAERWLRAREQRAFRLFHHFRPGLRGRAVRIASKGRSDTPHTITQSAAQSRRARA